MNAILHISSEWAHYRPLLSAIMEQTSMACCPFVTFFLHQKEEMKDQRFSSFGGIKEVESRRPKVEGRKSPSMATPHIEKDRHL